MRKPMIRCDEPTGAAPLFIWIAALVSLFMGMPFAQAEDLPVVRVAYFNSPPAIMVAADGRPVGPLVDIWERHIAAQGRFKIKWVGPIPGARLMLKSNSGRPADAWAQLVPNKERLEAFDFLAPITESRQWIFVRSHNPIDRIRSVDDLIGKDKVIARIIQGYLPPFILDSPKLAQLEFAELGAETAINQMVSMLALDRIWAAYYVFPEAIEYASAQQGVKEKIKKIPFPGSDKKMMSHVAVWKDIDPSLRAAIVRGQEKSAGKYNYEKMVARLSQ